MDALYMQATLSLAGQGGWPMTVFLTPDARPVLRGHLLPAARRAGACPPSPTCAAPWPTRTATRRDDVESQAGRGRAAAHGAPPSDRPPRASTGRCWRTPWWGWRGSSTRPRAASAGRPSSRPRWPSSSWPAACGGGPTTTTPARWLELTLGQDGGRRHLRPGGRGLPPLQRGRPLARAPLREDALRQRPAGPGVHAGPPGDRLAGPSVGGRVDARLPDPGDAAAGRRVRGGPGRRLARRRGRLLRVDAPGPGRPAVAGRGPGGDPALRGDRPRATSRGRRSCAWRRRSTPSRASWGRTPGRCWPRRARSSTPRARSGRRRPATTRSSRPGTAWRWPRWPRPAWRSGARTTWTPPRAPPRSCSTPWWWTGACAGRTCRAGPRQLGQLDDHADLCHGLLCLYDATFHPRWLAAARELADRMVELFADAEVGGFYYSGSDGEALVARTRDLEDHPTPGGQLAGRPRPAAAGRHHGRRRAGGAGAGRAAAGVRPTWPASPRRSVPRWSRSTITCPSAARWRSWAPATMSAPGPWSTPRAPPAAPTTPSPPAIRTTRRPLAAAPLLDGRPLVDGSPAAYVCRRFACLAPVVTAQELTAALSQ